MCFYFFQSNLQARLNYARKMTFLATSHSQSCHNRKDHRSTVIQSCLQFWLTKVETYGPQSIENQVTKMIESVEVSQIGQAYWVSHYFFTRIIYVKYLQPLSFSLIFFLKLHTSDMIITVAYLYSHALNSTLVENYV